MPSMTTNKNHIIRKFAVIGSAALAVTLSALTGSASAWGNGNICNDGQTITFETEEAYYAFLDANPDAVEGDCDETPPTTEAPPTTVVDTTTPDTSVPDTTVPPVCEAPNVLFEDGSCGAPYPDETAPDETAPEAPPVGLSTVTCPDGSQANIVESCPVVTTTTVVATDTGTAPPTTEAAAPLTPVPAGTSLPATGSSTPIKLSVAAAFIVLGYAVFRLTRRTV